MRTGDDCLLVFDTSVLLSRGILPRIEGTIARTLIPTLVKFELNFRSERSHVIDYLSRFPELKQLTMDGRVVLFSAEEPIDFVREKNITRARSCGNDEAILDACRMLQLTCLREVVLITDDVNMRLKGRGFGVRVCSSNEFLVSLNKI